MQEIIIDGVNVSECRYINKETPTDYSGCGQICYKTPCEYKIEYLKQEIQDLEDLASFKEERIKELQQENSDLKKYIERMDKPEIQVIDGKIALDNIKYKQALEDVKEIINFRFKTPYMTFGYKEYGKLIKDIEKVINEVLK